VNYVLYAIPFFVIAIIVEYLYGRRRGNNTYRLNDTVGSLQMGTLSRLRSVLHIGLGAGAYAALSDDYALLTLHTDSTMTWICGFIAYDLCYYFAHRYGHEWRLLWASHVAHHQSEEFNLSTALRQTSTGFLNFVFYIPLYVIGFPAYLLITVGSLNLIYQFWVHTEHVRTLGLLEWVLVTPSNHRVHHAKNPEYLDRNYGGVFIIWDRIFATFKAEDPARPCVYGTTRQLASFNPIWANLEVWYGGMRDMLQTRYPLDALKLWFKGPGWRPRDLRDTPKAQWLVAKYDPQISPFDRTYTFCQFWISVVASFAVLLGDLERTTTLSMAALMAYSLYVQGVWLEGRTYARTVEWLRLGLFAIAGWLGVNAWGETISMVIAGYLLASAICLLWAARTDSASLTHAPGKKPAL
jgi:sterol desaturase/sphingolipid hydroxylase (fatty acid hydroxylase superfamily)